MRLFLIMLVWLAVPAVGQADDVTDEKAKAAVPVALTLDEVARLKSIFGASSFEVAGDGTVTATYDFTTKDASLTEAFSPPMEKTKQRIRWSRGLEGTWNTVEDGLIIADQGVWLHKARWTEARMEAEYLSMSAVKKGDVLAAVFLPHKGKKLYGANLGQQCVKLKPNVKLAAKPIPARFPVASVQNRFSFGLEIKNKVLTALRNDRRAADTANDPKFVRKAQPGQLGLAWRGTINGFIFKITMTGKLDPAWVKKQLKS
ncbi:MAG: hypothetical protein AAF581_02710 [Planctomycetota bacterium]